FVADANGFYHCRHSKCLICPYKSNDKSLVVRHEEKEEHAKCCVGQVFTDCNISKVYTSEEYKKRCEHQAQIRANMNKKKRRKRRTKENNQKQQRIRKMMMMMNNHQLMKKQKHLFLDKR